MSGISLRTTEPKLPCTPLKEENRNETKWSCFTMWVSPMNLFQADLTDVPKDGISWFPPSVVPVLDPFVHFESESSAFSLLSESVLKAFSFPTFLFSWWKRDVGKIQIIPTCKDSGCCWSLRGREKCRKWNHCSLHALQTLNTLKRIVGCHPLSKAVRTESDVQILLNLTLLLLQILAFPLWSFNSCFRQQSCHMITAFIMGNADIFQSSLLQWPPDSLVVEFPLLQNCLFMNVTAWNLWRRRYYHMAQTLSSSCLFPWRLD